MLMDSASALSINISYRLKLYLGQDVPLASAPINIHLTHKAVVRFETASPEYFAVAPPSY
jgi:hypothetical protein